MADKMKWTDAWQQLVYEHSPLRAVDVADFQRLLRQLGEFERLLLANTALTPYANELTRPTPPTPSPPPSESPLSVGETSPDHLVRHVAAIQLQLMEDAFYSLRLDRHANAVDNRGWMNLFRRWGSSTTFVSHFRTMESLVGEAFARFFDHYVRGRGPIDQEPIPHPWDEHVSRGPESARGAGVYLDSGIIETTARSDRAESPSTQSAKRESGSAPASDADGAQDQGPARGEPNA